jgi:hypothetical protein
MEKRVCRQIQLHLVDVKRAFYRLAGAAGLQASAEEVEFEVRHTWLRGQRLNSAEACCGMLAC